MLNWVWAGMILISIVCSFFTHNGAAVTEATLTGTQNGVELVLKMLGTMCFWNGMMKILERSGLSERLSRLLAPVLRLLFPKLDPQSKAFQFITLNVSADLLGLGNAATPFGLKAMQELQKKSPLLHTATDDMVTLVVLNTASITLLPTTVAMLRSQAGSKASMDILPAVLITSFLALTIALIVTKLCNRARPADGQGGRQK